MRRTLFVLSIFLLMLTGAVQAQQSTSDFGAFVLNTRADLELLANEALGDGQRPEGWTFNVNNLNSPTFVSDLWYDNELLAEALTPGERPAGWIGAPVTKDSQIVVRNIRHDLELEADSFFQRGNRPAGWRGSTALYQCDRTLMNLVQVLQTQNNVAFQTQDTVVSFCNVIAGEAQDQVVKLALSSPEIDEALPDQILALRGDLERLADEKLGLNTRPPGWLGNKVKDSPTLLSDVYLDLETLANNLLANGQRPEGWISTLPTLRVIAYRALRYNLELLADAIGQIPRPRGWQGTNPIETCDPQIQGLVSLTQQDFAFSTENVPVEGNFCTTLALAANSIAENPPVSETIVEENDQFVGESQIAFSYLDSAATQYMGMMPLGTKFKAWYRNFGNSSMMFVSGDNFAVFIDRRWTSVPEEVYNRLPTTEGVKPLTFCDAGWCNGPGPTPTPTGGGAIQALLNAGTPPAAPDVGQIQENKTQVSWNNIRVTYLLDNAATKSAQVALEICQDTSQTNCEAVLTIFDNATGAERPVLSQYNGLNVYEFPYGYTANLVIEGPTLFSPDVWISDPTIR